MKIKNFLFYEDKPLFNWGEEAEAPNKVPAVGVPAVAVGYKAEHGKVVPAAATYDSFPFRQLSFANIHFFLKP